MDRGDHQGAARVRRRLLQDIRTHPGPDDRVQFHLKATWNELIRFYVRHGWTAEALEVSDRMMEGLDVDLYCPNRASVRHHIRARIWMEAGEWSMARAELAVAQAFSRRWLARVEQAWSQAGSAAGFLPGARRSLAPPQGLPVPCVQCAAP